ncbi:MAG: ETC complex I subunit [Bradyrhizobium sp.]|uniref:NADH dehydrogenase ubiquinone Fe-S protein 4 n=1 Tax=Bradyrhizobium sp. TaxID=376 RepID=UPI0029B4EB60|nr:NADH dehydrogenase ubiquinone Fe-S protein 4 [Bradyrhizobium sp.]MDX3965562.1 ETC complex I subunit [Bradyrhizobium sp.]
MEVVNTKILKQPVPEAVFADGNRRADRLFTPSVFPKGATAIIFRAAPSPMSSGRAHCEDWRLVFERRSAPYLEPLMGWTSDDDPLAQVELKFPTLRSAIRYAERQGLQYVVQTSHNEGADPAETPPAVTRAFSNATLERLGLGALQQSYVDAVAGAEARHDPRGNEGRVTPMAVAKDSALPIEAKRSILINWAWTEYLIEQASGCGKPDEQRRSRLGEVELALLELERTTTRPKPRREVGQGSEPTTELAA